MRDLVSYLRKFLLLCGNDVFCPLQTRFEQRKDGVNTFGFE